MDSLAESGSRHPLSYLLDKRLPLFTGQELKEPGDRVQERVRISVVQVCACQKIRADHLQAVTPGFIGSEDQTLLFHTPFLEAQ